VRASKEWGFYFLLHIHVHIHTHIHINTLQALRPNRREAPEIFREPGKYRTMMEFCEKSGWFTPSVEGVLVRKMGMQLTAFQSTKCGVYIFVHKTDPKKKYVGQSRNLSQDMNTSVSQVVREA